MQSASLMTAGMVIPGRWLPGTLVMGQAPQPLEQFDYGDVVLASDLHEKQLEETHSVLMGLSDDSLLKPFRQMSGQSAPGDDLGGWYQYNPDYKWGDAAGFAPSCTFGQWVSALARMYAIRPDEATRNKVLRLNRLYAQTISGDYYENNRFSTYCYDKLVCGLIDSQRYVGDPDAFSILEHTTNAALPHFPKHAVEHGKEWRPHKDETWTWDESYTISENLFLAYQRGAGERYRELGRQYLYDEYYDPLAEGRNVLAGRHAYSYVNSLSSAMQAYLTLGSEKYLRAARNAFEMLSQQSFATGGWGPDETLCAPDSADVYASLSNSHASFETPCGSYAHFKLTRYLLRVTRDSRYGDSMERMMYNTVLGAKPLQADGRTFYYSDYNFKGHKFYRDNQH
ncbi:MAG TPA: beta-L-arabinofuranosidase domain-containing protein [Terriglobales bacterium]|nr:beta-L-arabinofuranosidase domain-containing protein [Terriglobales bacterium]